MAKAPYFPLDAKDFILDEKLERLRDPENYKYLGILVTIWAHLWLNPVKRGHFLEQFNGKIQAIPDEIIAKKLHLTPQEWAEVKQKLTEAVPLLKIGKSKEVYSRRQSKHKTFYELYKKPSPNDDKPMAKESQPDASRIEGKVIEGKVIEVKGIRIELNVSEKEYTELKTTFPTVDHDTELIKANHYRKKNPTKAKKPDDYKFLFNWFQNSKKFDKEKPNGRKTDTSKYPESTPLNL
jgi:hypothetical protein